MQFDIIYRDLVNEILENGNEKITRGYKTKAIFGYTYKLDANIFPLLTLRKLSFKNIVTELLWFISGRTDVEYLIEKGNRIWDEWSDNAAWIEIKIYGDGQPYYKYDDGVIVRGSVNLIEIENKLKERGYTQHSPLKWVKGAGNIDAGYGKWWRNFGGFDQLSRIIQELKNNPNSRRMVVSAWNPKDAWNSKLPPCHDMWILNVLDKKLNLHLTQRSCDVGLGLPYNTASYVLLMYLLSVEGGLNVGEFSHTLVDAHIYENHKTSLKELIVRNDYDAGQIFINQKGIFDLEYSDFSLLNYAHGPKMNFEVAV